MLGFLRRVPRWKSLADARTSILGKVSSPSGEDLVVFGPFNSNTPRRWKKPVDSARTRLESRTRDLRLDGLMIQMKKLRKVLSLQEMISSRRGQYASLQLLSRWKTDVDLNMAIGAFLRKYPQVFEIFVHRIEKNMCCRITRKMAGLIEEEARIVRESESAAVLRLRKLLAISTRGTLHVHALWLARRELGLPDDFRTSVILSHPQDFRLESPETVSLVASGDLEIEAEVEKWREREHREKWLSEFEIRYAFPVQLPTGFQIEKGFREKLRNWQRLQYVKPYEKMEAAVRVRSCGGLERFEKRAVGIIHEFLSLTVEKMIEVERLSHFRRDFAMEVNVRELLLKHPGIFYISTKGGGSQVVFLREAYRRGSLVEPNAIYSVRRRMLDLILMGRRSTGCSHQLTEPEGGGGQEMSTDPVEGQRGGQWVVPLLESLSQRGIHKKILH